MMERKKGGIHLVGGDVEGDAGERAAWFTTGILNTFSTNRSAVCIRMDQSERRAGSRDQQAQAANIASIDTGDANCTDEVTFPTGELAQAVCSLLVGRAPQSANGGPGSGSGRWAVLG